MKNAFECYKCKVVKPVGDNPQWRLICSMKDNQKVAKMKVPICMECLEKEREKPGG